MLCCGPASLNLQMLVCKIIIKKLPFALDYLAMPGTTASDYPCGVIVEVPYRQSTSIGIVIQTTASLDVPLHKAKTIKSISRNRIDLTNIEAFYLKFANYYGASISELLTMVIPKRLWAMDDVDSPTWCHALPLNPSKESALTSSAQRLYRRLKQRGCMRYSQMLYEGYKSVTIQQCLDKVAIEAGDDTVRKKILEPPALSDIQKTVFEKIMLAPKGIHYINGVTGSGKTYLYIACARHWISLGYQVLLLVPEIGLTPQLYKKFETFVHACHIAMLHSALSDHQRAHIWKECANGDIKLLIGTRSALFVPMANLAVIIMDEEHDLSYKQLSQIRYSARGAAFMRAKADGCQLILGSATPSLACLRLINDARLTQHSLLSRYTDVRMPKVEIIPIHEEKCRVGFSRVALDAIQVAVDKRQRVLVFLNRRGYAPCLWCPACDQAITCPGCDRPFTYHQAEQRMACHRCQVVDAVTRQCQQCHTDSCIPLGQGTEKVSIFLQEHFPEVPVIKMDRDTCGTWGQLSATLGTIHKPGHKIIVATQMLIKGHHIDDLNTVIVLESDQSLKSKDYKAGETLLAQMGQVIGRSGRGREQGVVYIQSNYPDHPLWSFIREHQYDDAAAYLLNQRRQYSLPPYTAQLAVYFTSATMDKAQQLAAMLVKRLNAEHKNCTIIGPMPSLFAKLNGMHRAVVVIQSSQTASMHAIMQSVSQLKRTERQYSSIVFERDPVEI